MCLNELLRTFQIEVDSLEAFFRLDGCTNNEIGDPTLKTGENPNSFVYEPVTSPICNTSADTTVYYSNYAKQRYSTESYLNSPLNSSVLRPGASTQPRSSLPAHIMPVATPSGGDARKVHQ